MCSDHNPDPYLKGQGPTRHLPVRVHNARVRSVTYVCIDGLPSNLVQMLSSLRQCAVTLTQIHTSKVKVTQDQITCISYFPILYLW